jgi:SAM-dependent methyltransferase
VLLYRQSAETIRQEAALAAGLPLVERLAWQDVLRRQLPATGRKKPHVLQIGSGGGGFALLLAQTGTAVTGVEPSAELVAVAGERAREAGLTVPFITGSLTDPPFPPGQFDVLLAINVLGLLAEPLAALQAWLPLVREGGTLVVIEDGDDRPDSVRQRALMRAALAAADRSEVAEAYWQAIGRNPLAQATPPALTALVRLAGWQPEKEGVLRGQLERTGRYRLQRYGVGYMMVRGIRPGTAEGGTAEAVTTSGNR